MHKCVGRRCPNRAFLGHKRDKIPFYCIDHIVPHTKHIKVYKKCNVIGCHKNITYTDLNETTGTCSTHVLRNMKKCCYFMCFNENCYKNATHGAKDYPLFACADHAADLTLHDTKLCAYPLCEAESSCNYLGYKHKVFCNDHKLANMKDRERCIFHNCANHKNLSSLLINNIKNIICSPHAEIYRLALDNLKKPNKPSKPDKSKPKKTIEKNNKDHSARVTIEQPSEDCSFSAIQRYFEQADASLDQLSDLATPEPFTFTTIYEPSSDKFNSIENIFDLLPEWNDIPDFIF